MTFREPEPDPELDWLRRGHRSERAPDALRRRVLAAAAPVPSVQRERSQSTSLRERRPALALAAAVAIVVGFGVARRAMQERPGHASLTPPAPSDVVLSAERSAPRAPSSAGCPEPLPLSLWNPYEPGFQLKDFEAGVFETESKGCGPMTRRYVVRMPAGDASSAPVLIVLHDRGQSPEQAQIVTRWWFEDLARREHAVLVYANGAASLKGDGASVTHGGVWQLDEGAHPAVDDVDYLQGVVDHLRERRGVAATGGVFLVGYGSGGLMALTAAARHPERYVGVAAFAPGRTPAAGALALAAPSTGGQRLRSIFVALSDTTGPREAGSALAGQWASVFAREAVNARVSLPQAGVERIDASLAGPVALGIVRLSRDVDPFPGPGGDDPIVRAASQRRPFFFDGPGAAWAFFRQSSP